jgi:hypothetical protein
VFDRRERPELGNLKNESVVTFSLASMRWMHWENEADLDALIDKARAFIQRGLEPRATTPKERRR